MSDSFDRPISNDPLNAERISADILSQVYMVFNILNWNNFKKQKICIIELC